MGWNWNESLKRWEKVVGILGLVVQEFPEQRPGRWFVISNHTTDAEGFSSKEGAMLAAEQWADLIWMRIRADLAQTQGHAKGG